LTTTTNKQSLPLRGKTLMTMADLLKSASTSVSSLKSGQKVKGRVVSKNATSLVIDIGAKSEGIVAEKAFAEARDYISKLKVGDEVTVTVIFPETRDGSILLSLRDAIASSSWEHLEKSLKENTDVAVLGKNVSSAGVSVDVEGVQGFIPSSQLGKEAATDANALVGKYFKARVIEVDRQKNKLVLSEREVSDAEDIKSVKAELEKLKIGEVYEGRVTTVASFGCFVEITAGKSKLEGLVHVSEMSWGKVGSPSEVLKLGDKVKVAILGVKSGKLALSMKQALKDPWLEAAGKYKKDEKINGNIVKHTDFGIFVELEPGIEGLIHITKIPPTKKFNVGDSVNCYIEEVDVKRRKISLGLVLTAIPLGYK
jgi:small subunit ribosomal protein S1